MALPPQVTRDVTALTQIGVQAWNEINSTPDIPAGAKGAIAAVVTDLLGQAYLRDRALYQREPLPPGTSPQPER